MWEWLWNQERIGGWKTVSRNIDVKGVPVEVSERSEKDITGIWKNNDSYYHHGRKPSRKHSQIVFFRYVESRTFKRELVYIQLRRFLSKVLKMLPGFLLLIIKCKRREIH